MKLLALLIALGTCGTFVSAETASTELEHQWREGFKSYIKINLTRPVSNGWRITLYFNKAVTSLEIWRALIVSVSQNKSVYELRNKMWNRQLKKGEKLEMAFVGTKSVPGSPAPFAKIVFKRNEDTGPSALTPTHSTEPSQPTTRESTSEPQTAIPSRPTSELPTKPLIQTTQPGSPCETHPTTQLPSQPPSQPAPCALSTQLLSQSTTQKPTRPPCEMTEPPTQIASQKPSRPLSETQPTPPPSKSSTLSTVNPITKVPSSLQTSSPDSPQGNTGYLIVTDEWGEGFNGKLKFSIGKDTDGWIITLTFTRPVRDLLVWKGYVTPSSGASKHFTIANRHYSGNLKKCTSLELGMQAQKVFANEDVPPSHATINVPQADVNCLSTSPPVTQQPATNPPTHPTTGTITEGTTVVSLPPTSTQPPTTTVIPSSDKPTTSSSTQIPTTRKPQSGPYNYDEILQKSILFYEAQRSGKLPANNRVSWRKDSALNDRGDKGEDLTGGWYDAGDYVKFGFPMASSATILAWGLVEYRNAYVRAGELNIMLDSIKWATDYFVKAHTAKYEFYGQVGDGNKDHSYWGRPEDMTMPRPSFKIDTSHPGSDLAAETAAALAAASIAFKPTNLSYAQTLLRHAKELYEFADKYRGKYSDSITNAASFYKSWSGYKDELVWGAAWLYKATRDQTYLTKAESHATAGEFGGEIQEFSWDDKKAGALLLLAKITNKNTYKQKVQRFLDRWLPGGRVTYTPKGLAWLRQWGPNRYAANTAFLALVAADLGLRPNDYRNFARKQIHYMLGDSGRSYVVGFGTNPPKRPHHRSSSCPLAPAPCNWSNKDAPGPNPQVLYGALVGGPDKFDKYKDDRGDYIKNEVANDYNAGFQSAVAGLKSQQM